MTFYRCEICGETYLGDGPPSHCPFCGAREKYLVPASEWRDENASVTELSDSSRENLQIALQLEANNAPFYKDAAKRADNPEIQGIFKYLGKVENEHASTLKKILKVKAPPPEVGKEVAVDSAEDNLAAAHAREVAATEFYEKAAAQATETRVKKVFTALAEIEADHVALEKDLMDRGLL